MGCNRYALFALLWMAGLPAQAGNVAVYPVQGTNLGAAEVQAIGILLAEAYANVSQDSVLSPNDTQQRVGAIEIGPDAAKRLGVAAFIETRAVRLKTKVTVSSILYRADGKLLFRAAMSAASLDDVEQVVERIAQSLVHRKPVSQTLTIHNVTQKEASARQRVSTEKLTGFKTGFVVPVARGVRYRQALSLQFDGRLEGNRYFLEYGAGVLLPTSSSEKKRSFGGFFAELGASYYLTDANIAPYLGLGVVPSLLVHSSVDDGTDDGDTDGGVHLAAYGQIGLMFLRQSSSRLYTDLRVSQHIVPFTFSRQGKENTTRPTEIVFHVGVGW